MKKLIAVLSLAAIACGCVHAQTPAVVATPADQVAPAVPTAPATNAPAALTDAQVKAVHDFVDNLLPLIPPQDIPLAGKIIGYLSVFAVFGRFLKGYISTGSFAGALWHFIAGIFFNHTPPEKASGGTQGAGAAAQRMGLLLCLALPCLLFLPGCMTAIKQGDVVSITERGFGIHITATSSQTQTPEIMAGIFSQTVQLIPTHTNGPIYTPNFANSASVQNSLNPFSLAGDENTASGNMQTSLATNVVQQPIVPSHPAATLSN
jgi:hypothetical protein